MKQLCLGYAMTKLCAFPGALALILFLSACSPKYTTMTPELHSQLTSDLKNGKLNLNCQFKCDWSWLGNFKEMTALHNSSQWEPLAVLVMQVGHEKDIAYYFLGQASEGLGYKQAAQTYYQRSSELLGDTVSLHHCRSLDNGCAGINLASILPSRLASLKENNLSQPPAKQVQTVVTREGEQATQPLPSDTKTAQQISQAQLLPTAQAPASKVSAWFANLGEYPIGKPCKAFLASLSLPYRKGIQGNDFEISKGDKLHPEISTAGFDCTDGRISSVYLLSKWYRTKDVIPEPRQLTDKIIASLHLSENGWKLVSSGDVVDGQLNNWRDIYMKTYERNQAQIDFETYGSRDGESWVVQIRF